MHLHLGKRRRDGYILIPQTKSLPCITFSYFAIRLLTALISLFNWKIHSCEEIACIIKVDWLWWKRRKDTCWLQLSKWWQIFFDAESKHNKWLAFWRHSSCWRSHLWIIDGWEPPAAKRHPVSSCHSYTVFHTWASRAWEICTACTKNLEDLSQKLNLSCLIWGQSMKQADA